MKTELREKDLQTGQDSLRSSLERPTGLPVYHYEYPMVKSEYFNEPDIARR